VLEALGCGVPMVAIPIASDSPGVAARICRSGAGEAIRLSDLTSAELRKNVEQVRSTETYRRTALMLKACIDETRGAAAAADLIENVLTTGKPVLR